MVIRALNYADFKTTVNKLSTGVPTTLVVFSNRQGDFWFAWAVISDVVITVSLGTGEPNEFATDFPGRIDLVDALQVQ